MKLIPFEVDKDGVWWQIDPDTNERKRLSSHEEIMRAKAEEIRNASHQEIQCNWEMCHRIGTLLFLESDTRWCLKHGYALLCKQVLEDWLLNDSFYSSANEL